LQRAAEKSAALFLSGFLPVLAGDSFRHWPGMPRFSLSFALLHRGRKVQLFGITRNLRSICLDPFYNTRLLDSFLRFAGFKTGRNNDQRA
jgi:hypothetical protein